MNFISHWNFSVNLSMIIPLRMTIVCIMICVENVAHNAVDEYPTEFFYDSVIQKLGCLINSLTQITWMTCILDVQIQMQIQRHQITPVEGGLQNTASRRLHSLLCGKFSDKKRLGLWKPDVHRPQLCCKKCSRRVLLSFWN